MNYFNKNKTISIIVILMLIINITALITIMVDRHELIKSRPLSKKNDIERTTQFLKDELQFSDTQIDTFLQLQENFLKENKTSKTISGDIKFQLYESLRLNENNEDNTNILLKQLADNTFKMEQSTYQYFKEIKALCSDEQVNKFDMLMQQIQMKINPEHRPPENPQGPPPHLNSKEGEHPRPGKGPRPPRPPKNK